MNQVSDKGQSRAIHTLMTIMPAFCPKPEGIHPWIWIRSPRLSIPIWFTTLRCHVTSSILTFFYFSANSSNQTHEYVQHGKGRQEKTTNLPNRTIDHLHVAFRPAFTVPTNLDHVHGSGNQSSSNFVFNIFLKTAIMQKPVTRGYFDLGVMMGIGDCQISRKEDLSFGVYYDRWGYLSSLLENHNKLGSIICGW